jgi:pantothenate kinase
MLLMSEQGNNENVDLLVSDIYGCDYSKVGLKSTTIASSCGKIYKEPLKEKFQPQDVSLSLLYMVFNYLLILDK